MNAGRKIRTRRGAVLVAALVCLLVVMMIVGGLLLAAVRSARQLHRMRDLAQCERLLDAGTDRAVYRLTTESNYAGETWSVTTDSASGQGSGAVTIRIARPADAQTTRISITAEYPLGDETSIRRSSEITVPFNGPQPQE